MRHLRMIGLCLVAVFAIASVAATSASALPEWGQCYVQAKHEGKYTDKNCTVKAKKVSEKFTGEFEWRKSTEVKSKGFNGEGGTGILTTTFIICEPNPKRVPGTCASKGETEEKLGPISVECGTEVAFGEASGTKEVRNVAVTFNGCKLFGTSTCSNTPTEGEIRVNALKGTLGYISKSKKEVGVLLEPVIKKGEFAKFTCASVNLSTTVGVGNATEGCAYPLPACGGDGIISPITPVNQMTAALTQVYAINGSEENIPTKFEGKPIKLLEAFTANPSEPEVSSKWSKAGETITNVNHQRSGEEVEIKA
jgi:hypothetical protein